MCQTKTIQTPLFNEVGLREATAAVYVKSTMAHIYTYRKQAATYIIYHEIK